MERKLIFILMLAAAGWSGHAQERAAYFDEPGRIVLPDGYIRNKTYPLLIMLPYTTGTAEEFFNRYKEVLPADKYIVLLPAGRPEYDDYLPDFIQYTAWYEERIVKDIQRASRFYSVDPRRIVLAGSSLGGDLSWALTMRRPDLFAGAVIAGSRCSYPAEKSDMEELKKKRYRASFFIGIDETAARAEGLSRAKNLLTDWDIEVEYNEIEGAHVPPPVDEFPAAVSWVMGAN